MNKIIIEGVAGVGKTSVIASLMKTHVMQSALLIDEDQTLGELFSDLQDESIAHVQHVKRLESVLTKLRQAESNQSIILERFHHSYFALGIDWNLLRAIDKQLEEMSFKTVLLDLPDAEFERRSLKRAEREADGWEQSFIALYGSPQKAVEAFRESQLRRKQALQISRLKSEIVNTSRQDWDQIAQEILAFSKSV